MDSVVILRLLDEIAKLNAQLAELKQPIVNDPYESEQVNEIHAALSKAQGEYQRIGLNRDNPFFKSNYADLDTILQAVKAALCKNGLAFTQETKFEDTGATILHTKLRHASGQWISCRARILPPKNDVQSYGSTLTYQKRYAAMALLGITASHDPLDDDGEIAMAEARNMSAKGTAINTKYNPKEQSYDTINKEQLKELDYELAEYPDICEQVLEGLRIQSLSDMPADKYHAAINRIRSIKNMRNGIK